VNFLATTQLCFLLGQAFNHLYSQTHAEPDSSTVNFYRSAPAISFFAEVTSGVP
jgi:hypothetical protein